MNMNRLFAAAAIASAVLASAASASITNAPYVGGTSTEGLGAFDALVTYSYTSGTTATLQIQLTNTTALATGGFITALAVSPAGADSVAFVSCTMASFGGLADPVTASPFGDFMGGASTSSSWVGGGSPSVGIGVGWSATFVFTLTGSSAALAAQNADSVLSPVTGYGFAVRFRGMTGGGSDKVVGQIVPAPGAIALLAAAGLVVGRRRR
jgi:hypothetical protein